MWVGGWNRLSLGAGAAVESCCVDCTSRTSVRGSRGGSGAGGGRELDLGLILVLRLSLALSLELMLEQVLALELGMELTPALVTEPPCLPDDGDGRPELLPALVLELELVAAAVGSGDCTRFSVEVVLELILDWTVI